MKNYSIYKLTFPNGKVYIGQTSNITRRFYQYKSKQVKRQPYLQNCLEKYEWEEIKKEILYFDLTKELADEKEIELISEHTKSGQSINLASGGKSGLCKPIMQFDLQGNLLRVWSTVTEVCDFLKLPYSGSIYLGEICRNSKKVASNRYRNFLWLYKANYDKGERPKTGRVNPLIEKIDPSGNVIGTYFSCYEAAEDLGVSYMAVKQAMYRSQKCKGFHLKIKDHE